MNILRVTAYPDVFAPDTVYLKPLADGKFEIAITSEDGQGPVSYLREGSSSPQTPATTDVDYSDVMMLMGR